MYPPRLTLCSKEQKQSQTVSGVSIKAKCSFVLLVKLTRPSTESQQDFLHFYVYIVYVK